jgi:endonuclease VIII
VPEGDTILWAATRIRAAVNDCDDPIVEVRHAHERLRGWRDKLDGHRLTRVDTHGKHLFLHFEGGWVVHSHLRMSGAWDVRRLEGSSRRSPRRAWLVLRVGQHELVQFDGPVLELMTEGRRRFDQALASLGPDVLAAEFDYATFLARLRGLHPTLTLGDVLLDQRILAGIGNIWKSEGCWQAQIDPWRSVGSLSEGEARAIVERVRPRMLESGMTGPKSIRPRVYRRVGGPCPRCGTQIQSRRQGDDNRVTYWCPGCQY